MAATFGAENAHLQDRDYVQVYVDGAALSGWKSVSVSRSLTSAAGFFQVEIDPAETLPIQQGQELEVAIGPEGETRLLVGNIDDTDHVHSKRRHSYRATGRDRAGDMVDSAAALKPGTWSNATMSTVLQDLARDAKSRVDLVDVPDVTLTRFAVEPGETAWSAAERIFREQGLMAFSGSEGNLIVTRAGSAPAARVELVYGSNILEARHSVRGQGLFHTYLVRGQQPGTDALFGETAAHVEAQAVDELVRRDRTLEILATGALSQQDAQALVEWEATVRSARADAYTVIVPSSWRQNRPPERVDTGPLWEINQLVRLTHPYLRVDTELLVQQVTFASRPATGNTTTLELVRPDAYQSKPTISPPAPPLTDEEYRDLLEALGSPPP